MTNRQLNSQIKSLHEGFKLVLNDSTIDPRQIIENKVKNDCERIMNYVGAVSVMSQKSIVRMVRMQSHLKYMPEHKFLQAFVRAEEELNL